MGKISSSRNPAPSSAIGITMVVLRAPALARSAASASARIEAARAASVSRILAPSWPATSAMSAMSASSEIPVSRARSASAVHGGARAPLQRDQVEVAGQDLPEVGPPLGRVDPGDQVGREEQHDAADDRDDD